MTQNEIVKKLDMLKLPNSYVFTPVNLEEEKRKFFDSTSYSPIFKYKPVQNRNQSILRDLFAVTKISDVDPRVSDFYLELVQSKAEIHDLLNAVGNNKLVTEISRNRFGKPSETLFKNAGMVLRGKVESYDLIEKKKDEPRTLDYEKVSEVMNIVLQELGLTDWSVAKSARIAQEGMKVGVKRKEVLLSPEISASKLSLRKSIAHEIGTHVIRSYNGMNSGIPALSKPNTTEYLDIEEGLATYNEELMRTLTYDVLKRKAIFCWVLYWAENLTFRELYNSLTSLVASNLAFDFAYRVKRGLGNTSLPGLYYKDVVYFRGYRKVRKAIAKDASVYKKLYAGKISMKQIKWVEDGLLPKPKLIFDSDKFNQIFKKAGI